MNNHSQSLHHEYLQRHSVDIPLVFYDKKINIILKSTTENIQWRILSLLWRPQDYHPGFYEVNYLEAVRNGFEASRCFKDLIRSDVWYWDQYETNLLQLVKKTKVDNFLAIRPSGQMLAAWEIFLFVVDAHLSQIVDLDFIKLLQESVCAKNTIAKKLKAFRKAERLLKYYFNDAWSFWHYRIKPIANSPNNNNQWLIKIIND